VGKPCPFPLSLDLINLQLTNNSCARVNRDKKSDPPPLSTRIVRQRIRYFYPCRV
jgi:hypothetical protein